MPREIETYKTVPVTAKLIGENGTITVGHTDFTGVTLSEINIGLRGDFTDADPSNHILGVQQHIISALNIFREYLNRVHEMSLVEVDNIDIGFVDVTDTNEDTVTEAFNFLLNQFDNVFNDFLSEVERNRGFTYGITSDLDYTAPILLFSGFSAGDLNAARDEVNESIEGMLNNIVFNSYYNNASFSRDINIEFIPDEVVLKNVSINNIGYENSDHMLFLRSNLIPGSPILFSFPNLSMYNEALDIPFRLKSPVNGTYNFNFVTILGKPPSQALIPYFSIEIAFTLLFIKFKSKE